MSINVLPRIVDQLFLLTLSENEFLTRNQFIAPKLFSLLLSALVNAVRGLR